MLLLRYFIKIWSIASLFCLLFLGSLQAQTATCRLYDAYIRDGGICQGEKETLLYYGFAKENITADSFDIFVDGEWQETKKFNSLDPDNYNSTFLKTPGIKQLTICVQGDRECCVTTSFVAPNCEITPNCAFNNIKTTTHSCQEDGSFFVDIEFQTLTPLSDSFRILDHEIDYGIFEYGQPFYTIGPVENIPNKRYEFVFQDSKNQICLDFTVLSATNFCKSSFVWPGDTNFDNVVDNFDLANISLIFGTTGPSRLQTDIEFEAKTVPDWDGQFSDGLNFKHADCNGDGIISEADVVAVRENYFNSHGSKPEKITTDEDGNAPILFVDFPELSIDDKDKTITAPIIFGTNDLPATAYGIAFTAVFDADLLKNGDVVFTDNWLGTTTEDLLIVNQNISSSGVIEVAISKKDIINGIGSGPIGNFIVIIDNIEGYTGKSAIEFKNVQVIDKNGASVAVHAPPTEILVNLNSTTNDYTLTEEATAIRIYPNPAKDWLFLESTLVDKIEAIYIRGVSGQLVNTINNTSSVIPVNHLVAGIYIIEVQTKTGRYFKKFLKE